VTGGMKKIQETKDGDLNETEKQNRNSILQG
jgi:hypothetical protein